jgi:hypothetical protein
VPKLVVILASLTSLAWLFSLYPNETYTTLMVVAIPVILSFVGLVGYERQRDAGIAIVLVSLLVFFLSGWIGLSYLPTAILLLISKRAGALCPGPSTPSEIRRSRS